MLTAILLDWQVHWQELNLYEYFLCSRDARQLYFCFVITLYLAVCAGYSGSELFLVQTAASRDMAQKTPEDYNALQQEKLDLSEKSRD